MEDSQLKAICDQLNILTHKEIDEYLDSCRIPNLARKTVTTGFGYIPGSNKNEKLFNSLKNTSEVNVYKFIEMVVNPIKYTDFSKREKYNNLVVELNKVLLFDGKQINPSGKIIVVKQASTLDEVDERVCSLSRKLYDRKIHSEVQKYCTKDLLKRDYFEAVFEAAKGLAERVRNITGLRLDGSELFDKAFALGDPYLFFNALSDKSEKSEHNGLKELLNAIFHLVRNPQAHKPKLNWPVEEDKALEILTMISFAHKYLDMCNKMPGK